MSDSGDFVKIAEAVARHLWGEPNAKQSKKTELRWGKNGSRSLVVEKGTWFDNEAKEGGGVLDLVKREKGVEGREAVEWLREQGFDLPADQRRSSQVSTAPERKPEPEKANKLGELAKTWDYVDENGKLLLQVCRFEQEGGGKTYRQRVPAARGRWDWKIGKTRIVPYALPELLEAAAKHEDVWIVEGEKCADRLREQGLTATCNPMGAGKWKPEFAEYFKGVRKVVMLPDNDDVGRNHMHDVATSLQSVVADLTWLDIPGLEEKEDVFDYYESGGNTDDLFALVTEEGRRWTPESPKSQFGAIRFEDLDIPGEELQPIIDGFYTVADISVTAGPSKSGKSFLLTHAGMVVAMHSAGYTRLVPDFFGHKVITPGLVIYFAGEGARGVKKRLRAFRKEFKLPKDAHVPFVLLTKRLDLLRPGFGDKPSDTDKLIAECKAWQAYYQAPHVLTIIDTLATASAGADENSAKDMTTIFNNCAKIRDETGSHVALAHHMNASGGKVRGHSSIYANADQIVLVTKDEQTKIRTALLDKNKDEEDGRRLHFELKIVTLGYDERTARDITSCVVLDVGEKNAKSKEPKNLYHPSDGEAVYLKALFAVLKKKGLPPPADLDVPLRTNKVALLADVRDEFDSKFFVDEAEDSKADQRRRAARSRAGKALIKFGVIGTEKTFIWHTGRPIKGRDFKHTLPEVESDEPPPLPLSTDDVDAFIGDR